MNTTITNSLNTLNEEIEVLIKRHNENLDYIDWINETSRKFMISHQNISNKPHPLNGWDQSKKDFIEKDFTMFMSKLCEQEINAHTENRGLIKEINDLKSKNSEKESPKNNDKNKEINIISPLPCETCKEIWCVCYENSDDEFDTEYEEFWEDYYSKMVNGLIKDDQ